jgi:hypothetical protein
MLKTDGGSVCPLGFSLPYYTCGTVCHTMVLILSNADLFESVEHLLAKREKGSGILPSPRKMLVNASVCKKKHYI